MAKQPTPAGDPFDAATRARLRAVGRYEVVADAGYCEVHFGRVPALAADPTEFGMSWYVGGPGRAVPAPADGLFALWERYRAAHGDLCGQYRLLLFGLFSRSYQAGYDDRQWRQLRRSRPTEGDLRSVVGGATVSLHQRQDRAGQPSGYEVQVAFGVFWDEHGVAMRLSEAGDGFTLGEWSGGDL